MRLASVAAMAMLMAASLVKSEVSYPSVIRDLFASTGVEIPVRLHKRDYYEVSTAIPLRINPVSVQQTDLLQSYTGHATLSPAFGLYWRLNEAAGLINITLVLDTVGLTLDRPWMGIGIGRSMLNSEFILFHIDPKSDPSQIRMYIHEHQTTKKYSKPVILSTSISISVNPSSEMFKKTGQRHPN